LKKGIEEVGADGHDDEVHDENLAGLSDSVTFCLTVVSFLADRTNGRAIGTVLFLSSVICL